MTLNDRLLIRLEHLEGMLRPIHEAIRSLRGEIHEAEGRFPTPLGPPDNTYGALTLAASEPDPRWIPVIHRFAREERPYDFPCNKPALYLTKPPTQHQNARLEVMRIKARGESGWRPPTREDEPRCSWCQMVIDPFSSGDLDYLSVMVPSTPGEQPSSSPVGVGLLDSSAERPGLSPSMSPVPTGEPPLTPEAHHEMIDAALHLSDLLGLGPDASPRKP